MSVEYETKGNIAIITLNRPEARNAINGVMASGIEAAVDKMEEDPNIWAGIMTANGKAFCAGADLKEISAGNAAAINTKRGGFAGFVQRERTKPLIAAVTGTAVAGGTEICLACDMIICSEETIFGLPEVKRSLVAAAGGLFRLPRAIGSAVALEAALTGDPLPAERAYQLGMVNKVVPTDQVMAEAEALAARITANAPIAVQQSRSVVLQAFTEDDDTLWRKGSEAFRVVAKTEDYKEGPLAFIEKRAPVWKGK